MRKSEYQANQRGRDIHEQFKSKQDVKIPLEEVFFLVTRDGAETFTNMFENSIRNIVQEEVDKAFRSVAKGMQRGFSEVVNNPGYESMTEVLNEYLQSDVESQLDYYNKVAKVTERENVTTDWTPTPEDTSPGIVVGYDFKSEDTNTSIDEPEKVESMNFERDIEPYLEPEPVKLKRGDEWTDQEDQELVAAVFKGVKEGKSRNVIYAEQSEVLGRTVSSVRNRWTKKFASKYRDDIKNLWFNRK